MDMLVVDSTMDLTPPTGSGGKYWALDLTDAENLPPGMSGMLDQMDPLKSMEAFGEALESVEYEGSEEVDGDTLDRYQLTVDTAEIAQLGDMAKQGVDIPETVDYDLWLDDEGLMRRMETGFEVQGQQLDIEVTLDDWGKDVSIEAPPKSQVADFPTGLAG